MPASFDTDYIIVEDKMCKDFLPFWSGSDSNLLGRDFVKSFSKARMIARPAMKVLTEALGSSHFYK